MRARLRRPRPGAADRHGLLRGLLRGRGDAGFSTAALFIIATPLLVLAFGIGLDSARLVYIHQWLQGQADIAVASGTNIAHAAGGRTWLGTPGQRGAEAAIAKAEEIYRLNTATKRATAPGQPAYLMPAGVGFGRAHAAQVGAVPPTTAELCVNASTLAASGRLYGLTLTATERVNASFLRMFGVVDHFDITVTSTAYVRGQGC